MGGRGEGQWDGKPLAQLLREVMERAGTLEEALESLRKGPRMVCMTSNIHSALFAPDTLEFWVANADSANPAAHARFTHYNLAELLQPEKKPVNGSGQRSRGE